MISDGSGGYYVAGRTTGGTFEGGFVTHILSNGTQQASWGNRGSSQYYLPSGQTDFCLNGIVRQSSGNVVCAGLNTTGGTLKIYVMTSAGKDFSGYATNYVNSSIVPQFCAIDSNDKVVIVLFLD